LSWPKSVQKILDVIPSGAPKPFDFLQRGKPFKEGLKIVSILEMKELDEEKNLLLRAVLYLYFDGFDEAHQIAQDHEGFVGNWIHAVAHRREPDAGNSKYWYQRTEVPEGARRDIGQQALSILDRNPLGELEPLRKKLSAAKVWEPKFFVDLSDTYRKEGPASRVYQRLAEIQTVEWEGLLSCLLR
jgi:hypothetical protein